MSLTNTQIGLVILVVVAVGYLIYSFKCSEDFTEVFDKNKPYTYVGSFKDHPNRRIKKKAPNDKTFNECQQYAKDNNKPFFALQYPRFINGELKAECFVGNSDDFEKAIKLGKADPKNNLRFIKNNNAKLINENNVVIQEGYNYDGKMNVGGSYVNAIYSQNNLPALNAVPSKTNPIPLLSGTNTDYTQNNLVDYIGCYKDSRNRTIKLNNNNKIINNQTIDLCYKQALDNKATYFGLQYSQDNVKGDCMLGNNSINTATSLGSPSSKNVCQMKDDKYYGKSYSNAIYLMPPQ